MGKRKEKRKWKVSCRFSTVVNFLLHSEHKQISGVECKWSFVCFLFHSVTCCWTVVTYSQGLFFSPSYFAYLFSVCVVVAWLAMLQRDLKSSGKREKTNITAHKCAAWCVCAGNAENLDRIFHVFFSRLLNQPKLGKSTRCELHNCTYTQVSVSVSISTVSFPHHVRYCTNRLKLFALSIIWWEWTKS